MAEATDVLSSVCSLTAPAGSIKSAATLLPAALGHPRGPVPDEQDDGTFAGCLDLIFRVADAVSAPDGDYNDDAGEVTSLAQCGELDASGNGCLCLLPLLSIGFSLLLSPPLSSSPFSLSFPFSLSLCQEERKA